MVVVLLQVPCPDGIEGIWHVDLGSAYPLIDFCILIMVEYKEVKGREFIASSEELVG